MDTIRNCTPIFVPTANEQRGIRHNSTRRLSRTGSTKELLLEVRRERVHRVTWSSRSQMPASANLSLPVVPLSSPTGTCCLMGQRIQEKKRKESRILWEVGDNIIIQKTIYVLKHNK